MSQAFRLLLYITLILASFQVSAQRELKPVEVDSMYLEDQFYVGITYNLISNVPDAVNIRGLSGGLQFGYLRDIPLNEKRNVAIAIGAGLSFDQFGQTLFIGEDLNNETIFSVLKESEVTYDRNRFTTSTVEIPLELRWRTSTPETYRFWRIYAGFRVGYTYYFRATFKQPGNSGSQTDVPEFDRLRLATTISLGYNSFNFFASYSINPYFKDAVTIDGLPVEFRTIKIGLMFYLL